MHHLPDRRPRDDLRAAVVRALLPDEEPGRAGEGPSGGRRGARHHRGARVRAGAAAHLRPAGPRRVAAAVADRARLHPRPVRGHRDRRPVRDPRPHPDARAEPGAAPRDVGVGRRRRGVQPRPHGAGADGRAPAQRLQALRHRAAGLHRAAVRAAGGHAGARHAAAALRVRRPPAVRAQGQDDPHDEARRLPHPGPPPCRRAPRPGRSGGRSGAGRRRPGGRAGPARRPARHPAQRAVRVQPRHRRVDRHPPGPGGHRTRLRRHPRRARRPRRRPAPRRRRADRLLLLQRHPSRQRRRVLPLDQGCPHRCGRRPGLHRLRLRQHGVGRHLPGRPDPARRAARRPRRTPGPRPRRGQRRGRLRRRLPRLAQRPLGRPRRRPRPARRGGRDRGPDRTAAVDHPDQPAGHQPGDRLLRRPAGAGPGQPRAHLGPEREAGRPLHPAPRDRAPVRDGVRGRRPPGGAPAQRHRPHPPGDGAVRRSTPGST